MECVAKQMGVVETFVVQLSGLFAELLVLSLRMQTDWIVKESNIKSPLHVCKWKHGF